MGNMFADKVNFNEVEREDDLGHKVNFSEAESRVVWAKFILMKMNYFILGVLKVMLKVLAVAKHQKQLKLQIIH